MRVSSIFVAAGLALFANAQTTTEAVAPTTTDAATAALNSAQAEMVRCVEACASDDVNCQARCIAVPSPNEDQVNATTDCVAECPQGDGSEADTAAYSECVNKCIGDHYFTPTAGTPSPTGAAGGSNGNGNGNGNGNNNNNNNGDDSNDNEDGDDNGDGPSGTSGNQESGTGSNPENTEESGARTLGVASGVMGLVGFVAAVMAL